MAAGWRPAVSRGGDGRCRHVSGGSRGRHGLVAHALDSGIGYTAQRVLERSSSCKVRRVIEVIGRPIGQGGDDQTDREDIDERQDQYCTAFST